MDLTFHVCSSKLYTFDYALCRDQAVTVNFVTKPYPVPSIDRSQWTVGQARYLRVGATQDISLPVTGGTATILPASLSSEVSWNAGTLHLSPQVEGLKQFQLTVTSPWGDVTSESFSMDVAPADWPSTVILGDPLVSAEPRRTLQLFDKARILDPEFEKIDQRTLALTDTLVLGTSLLSRLDLLSTVSPALEKAKVVFIQTPLASIAPMQTLLGAFIADFPGFSGRFTAQSPALNLLKFVNLPGSPVGDAFPNLKLAGKLTKESVFPLVLNGTTSGSCTPVLGLHLRSQTDSSYVMTSRCAGLKGNIFIISGFEWGDIATPQPDDLAAIKKWIGALVKPARH